MATLGQKPATQHVSTEKQTITGNGGTSYTLQQSVSQAADIEVFVNNTRQEPTVAYTASGNTLTMTGAVNASDSFYVIFQGKAIQTAGLPVDAAITASTITASQSLNVTGHGSFTSGSDTALSLNRETSDGTIIDLQKDGTGVGSIGVHGGTKLYIGSGAAGLRFTDGNTDLINPYNTSTNADADGTVNLGYDGGRFKDLYLSGGVYLGGTGSANQLDDYEEGTFTPSITFGGGSTGIAYVSGRQSGIYTKIGNCVEYSIHLQMTSKGSSTGVVQITGLPFTSSSNDHYIPSAVWIQAMASMSGGFPTFRVNTNSTILDAYQLSSNTYSALTNSNCTDTTAFQISGKYYV